MLDILIIAPHPDDAELGMGGGILKFKEQGLRTGVLDLTNGEPTPHGSPEIRARETAEATTILGLDWRDNLGLPNRSLETTLAARE
ncbi:MAG TPA: bacillithiol biosynthesis deacetylase BshB1, partial [Planctomycetaceae bacterium]|nr:bacillithiol biosynthesis deacetylase BshB1 [Planctomycetaceae bacterium]